MDNATLDIVGKCLALNQSLFKEVYNEKLWDWYRKLALISTGPEHDHLSFDKGIARFHDIPIKSGILISLKRSLLFPARAMALLNEYAPQRVNAYYENEMKKDYRTLTEKELMKKFSALWGKITDHFRFAALANLITQYKLRIDIPEEYQHDIPAMRYNAIIALHAGEIDRLDFDATFGFFSNSDYDLSAKRYYEMKEVPLYSDRPLDMHPGPHNLREHVKSRTVRLIALLRETLLAMEDPSVFYKTKEELLKGKKIDVDARIAELEGHPSKDKWSGEGPLEGKVLSGKGIFSGRVTVVRGPEDYHAVKQGSIIVTETLPPDLVMLFPKVMGIIAEKGGMLSHVAVVARESGLPVLGQVAGAASVLKTGDIVKVDLARGIIVFSAGSGAN